jgi:hypothetical protein
MNSYELSLRALVPKNEVTLFLGTYFGVDPVRIGTEAEYWDRINTSSPLPAGLTVRASDEGYRTFASWVHESDLSPASFLTLALEAAKKFATEVAIADVVDPTDTAVGKYLIVSPDGRLQRAVELENSTRFELQPLPGDERVTDIVRLLEQRP